MLDQGQAGARTRQAAERIAEAVAERVNGKSWTRIPMSQLRELTGLPANLVRRSAKYAEQCGLIRLAAAQEFGVLVAKTGHKKGVKELSRIGGHLYLIQFTGGVLKVGYSADPEARLQAHRNTARVWGQSEVRHIVSQYYDNARAAEGYLIDTACFFAERICGEWFNATDFEALFERMSTVFDSHPAKESM